ncbi:molybdopterin-dependent oxidoreductase [Ferrovibrio sp.]|uniref:molybdopterin-dependent oxidoreductase n=1 Tax=Ferrovibrio sp. TaxID=1917215 RepID=UPI0035B36811
MNETRSTCPYCGVGCGVLLRPTSEGGLDVRGDPEHPANRGRLCSKGAALGETIGLQDRLLHPQIHGRRAGWDEALNLVARRFAATIAAHGPDSVAFYLSGQLLTEDYYVANKLMKGFIGSGNIDTNSRLCMASAVAGHRRAFGSDTVPGVYEDIELADLVVLVGSNLAWCHPVLFQRLQAAKTARPELRVVVIDPRRTQTTRFADLHLPLLPGSDVALLNGLLHYLAGHGATDDAFVAAHVQGAEAALAEAAGFDISQVARLTGLTPDLLRQFYAWFAETPRVVTGFSMGVNQSSSGTDKVNAIINCHLLTGRIGKPGASPFSITGQPNAMGGREVGGLANLLAAHMEIETPAHRALVRDFWQARHLTEKPGLKAVEMFAALREGRIKAIWIGATNPVDSLPEADLVRAALQACPFVVVSDVTMASDSVAMGHVLLPAAAWGEKDGTVTNSERRISRQRAALPLPGQARPDWWIFAQVAQRMGFADAFDYPDAATIFREHAALSGLGNDGSRDFDISALTELSSWAYDALPPLQWPLPRGAELSDTPKRFFGDGGFYTPDRRARMLALPYRAPTGNTDADYPLVLNTGRLRDQWHTMTRTGKAARLMAHIAEPFAELHPEDAAQLGIVPAGLVMVESPRGHVLVRALLSEDQQRGSVFVPLHWTDQLASRARVDALIAPHRDPFSGQPELKFTPVRARPYKAAWYGFAVLAQKPMMPDCDYWALAPAQAGWRLELAHDAMPADWDGFARILFGLNSDDAMLAYHDRASGRVRLAAFRDGRLLGALFVAPEPVEVSRAWAAAQLERCDLSPAECLRLLAGRAGNDRPDQGAILCACHGVGVNPILRAITEAGCNSVAAVGVATKAGTNCGSCQGEIRKLLDANTIQKAG